MVRNVRKYATWVAMSCMATLLVDGLLGWLPADFGVMLFAVAFFGVGVAALCQILICCSFLLTKFGLGETWKEWAEENAREEAERFRQ